MDREKGGGIYLRYIPFVPSFVRRVFRLTRSLQYRLGLWSNGAQVLDVSYSQPGMEGRPWA
jgi:hypothetical protein